MRAEAQQLGHPAQLRLHHGLPVDDANDGAVLGRRQGAAPLLARTRGIRQDPAEPDLVAVEKGTQPRARRVPAIADHDRARRRQIGRDPLQRADPLSRQRAELHPDLGRRGCNRVVLLGLDAYDARRLYGAEAHRERRAERHRHLADQIAHATSAEDPLDPVHEPDRLHAPCEDREERPLVARIDRVLARNEPDVR